MPVCEVCNITLNCESQMMQHLNGSKHKNRLNKLESGDNPTLTGNDNMEVLTPAKKKTGEVHYCDVCNINTPCQYSFTLHLAGKKHLKNLESGGQKKEGDAADGSAPIGPNMPKATKRKAEVINKTCDICDVTCIGEQAFETHRSGKKHIKKMKMNQLGGEALKCTICNVSVTSQETLEQHYQGERHRKAIAAKGNADLPMGGAKLPPGMGMRAVTKKPIEFAPRNDKPPPFCLGLLLDKEQKIVEEQNKAQQQQRVSRFSPSAVAATTAPGQGHLRRTKPFVSGGILSSSGSVI